MRKNFSVLLFCGFLLQCANICEKPDNLISKILMADILVDYYLYKETNPDIMGNSKRIDFPKINIAIVKKHNVNFEQFNQSLDYYYLQDRENYLKILNIVEGRLSEMAPVFAEKVDEQEEIKTKKTNPKTKPKLKKTNAIKDSVILNLDEKGKLRIKRDSLRYQKEISQNKKLETLRAIPKGKSAKKKSVK